MYPDMPDMPEPTSILFHRWYNHPLARGSYSNWPASFFQEHHDNLRATLDERVWFAGEHCSQKYFVSASSFCSWQSCSLQALRLGFLAWCVVRRAGRRSRTRAVHPGWWMREYQAALRGCEECSAILGRRVQRQAEVSSWTLFNSRWRAFQTTMHAF